MNDVELFLASLGGRDDPQRQSRRVRAASPLGARLRSRRRELGMTLSRLALASDVSLHTLRNYEAGLTTPDKARLARLARALGVSPGWLAAA